MGEAASKQENEEKVLIQLEINKNQRRRLQLIENDSDHLIILGKFDYSV